MIEFIVDPIRLDLDERYVQSQLSELGGRAQTVIRRGMRNTPKTGRRYRRGTRTHIASSPGGYPAIDTGRLAGSIEVSVAAFSVEIGTSVRYAKFVDPTRPFLEPGLRTAIAEFPDFMENYVVVEAA